MGNILKFEKPKSKQSYHDIVNSLTYDLIHLTLTNGYAYKVWLSEVEKIEYEWCKPNKGMIHDFSRRHHGSMIQYPPGEQYFLNEADAKRKIRTNGSL